MYSPHQGSATLRSGVAFGFLQAHSMLQLCAKPQLILVALDVEQGAGQEPGHKVAAEAEK